MTQPISCRFDGRVALVTGAARGIGREVVRILVERGASVVANDIREDVHLLQSDKVATLVGDVADEATASASVERALARFGRLDVLVNNAGRTLNRPLTDTSAAEWDALMATNVRGCFLHSREAVRVMVGQGGGSIVSVASIVSAVGMAEAAAYVASKGAVAQLVKAIAVEYGGRGIRANAVAPGVVETDLLEGMFENSRATLASYGGAHALGRVAQPSEIAEVVAFLASPAASFITGALVMADGGYTAL